MRRFKPARYEDGCTLGPKGPGGPDDDYEEPPEVEKCDMCDCGEVATHGDLCGECDAEAERELEFRVAAMVKDGAD